MRLKKYIPLDFDVVVTSYGGVGTTFIIDFIRQYYRVNDRIDKDKLKHLPYPPLSLNRDLKFIYLVGDPVMAAISLFRRNLHHHQSKKIIRGLRNKEQPIPATMTIEQFASEGIDRFYFQEHFNNWYNFLHTNPVLFLKYDAIYDNLEKIFDFLNLPREFVSTFPPFRTRESHKLKLSDNTLEQLQTIYHDFNVELRQVPDITVYYPDSGKFIKNIKSYSHFSASSIYWGVRKAIAPTHGWLRSKLNF